MPKARKMEKTAMLEEKDREAILSLMRKVKKKGVTEFINRAREIKDVELMMSLLEEFLDFLANPRGAAWGEIAACIYGLEAYFKK